MPTISGQALGRRKPLFADYAVPLPATANSGSFTLRDLLAHVVSSEVAAFRDRQEERKLLKALSAAQIADGVAKGKVDMGGWDLEQTVDEPVAIATAIEAFTDGLFLVVLDGEEIKQIDQRISVTPESRITFVRLAMLAGG
ncbi:hypothetical protein [Zavarzinella formosa]|uniref:hypothetical protein n=1 Tax=Zavarzinella formosa TaxID=360055 RepID=UPI0002D89C2E|nr:hypothetical protein [Zavarzinella formosa]